MLITVSFDLNPLNELPEKEGNYWIFEVGKDDKPVDVGLVTFRDGKWNLMDDVMANPKDYNDFYWSDKVDVR